jgi:hypothetical protein
MALVPSTWLPLLYFGFAHICLAAALGLLAVHPSIPGPFFLHPRMIAVVHLVTLGWISGSILGAFYIVGPLALRLPLQSRWGDRVAFGAFVSGTTGMVVHFWIGEYSGMVYSALLVAGAVLHVAVRAWRGLGEAVLPWPVKLHVALAFANMIGASVLGMLIGLNRIGRWWAWSPLSSAWAHAHLAAIGWAAMMVVGLSYRLIPMIVPAAMPTSASLAISAVLMEAGVIVLVFTLIAGSAWSAAGALLIVGGLASFVTQIRGVLKHRLPKPAALPRPDWSTWQTHAALLWLLVATALGLLLAMPLRLGTRIPIAWIYGTLGLGGFLAQIVIGIQGRLLPMHAWYRAFKAGGFQPPLRSAHTLSRPTLARAIFFTWLVGIPVLAAGLASGTPPLIRIGSVLLLAGVAVNAWQSVVFVREADKSRRA